MVACDDFILTGDSKGGLTQFKYGKNGKCCDDRINITQHFNGAITQLQLTPDKKHILYIVNNDVFLKSI